VSGEEKGSRSHLRLRGAQRAQGYFYLLRLIVSTQFSPNKNSFQENGGASNNDRGQESRGVDIFNRQKGDSKMSV